MEGLWLDQVDAVAQLGRRAAGDAQLEAIGAGGVGPLVGAPAQPVYELTAKP